MSDKKEIKIILAKGVPSAAMQIDLVPIDDLNPAEYNPRALGEDEEEHLIKSIQEFGMVEPLIVNSHPSRSNIVIGGHQRLKVLRKLGYEDVPVFYIAIEDERKERELNLRLNKNTGHFDNDLLALMGADLLGEVGFSEKELDAIFADIEEPKEQIKGAVPFSTDLMEEHNYVVLAFADRLSWIRLQTLYPLEAVKSKRSREGWHQQGVGRVVDGNLFLDGMIEERANPEAVPISKALIEKVLGSYATGSWDKADIEALGAAIGKDEAFIDSVWNQEIDL